MYAFAWKTLKFKNLKKDYSVKKQIGNVKQNNNSAILLLHRQAFIKYFKSILKANEAQNRY